MRDGPVRRALLWLARHQQEDGSWGGIDSIRSCGRCTAPGKRDYRPAITGLSLLAFVGAGHTHRDGEHAGEVRAAAKYLIDRQEESGSFYPPRMPEVEREMYGNGIATFALCELYRHSRSPQLRAAAERGVRFIERAQAPYAGWRYLPNSRETDTSVTGWQVLALTSAARAGIRVNPVMKYGVEAWLERVTEPVTKRVGYSRRGAGSLGMTATGLAMRLLLGEKRGTAEVVGEARLLRANPPFWPIKAEPSPPDNPPDIVYWYFGTIAASRIGGDTWRLWRRAVEPALLTHQETGGHLRGSFPPPGRWSEVGGRVFATAGSTMILTITGESERAFR
jgi:hypothetical protein